MSIHNTPAEEAAKREGYVRGRNDENYVQNDLRVRDRAVVGANDSAASGLVFGLIIALLAALVGGAFYFLSGDRGNNVVPVAVPQTETETTNEIKLPDVNVPDVNVPDVNVPDVNVPDVNVPDVNITNETPAAPAQEPAAPPAQ